MDVPGHQLMANSFQSVVFCHKSTQIYIYMFSCLWLRHVEHKFND